MTRNGAASSAAPAPACAGVAGVPGALTHAGGGGCREHVNLARHGHGGGGWPASCAVPACPGAGRGLVAGAPWSLATSATPTVAAQQGHDRGTAAIAAAMATGSQGAGGGALGPLAPPPPPPPAQVGLGRC